MSDTRPPEPPSIPPAGPTQPGPARGRSTGVIVGAVVLAFALGALLMAIVVGSGGEPGEQSSPTPTVSASPASPIPTASPVGTVTVAGPARTSLLAAGEAIPDFSAPALAGGTLKWSDYVGTPTVLTVWAPWCPHCQAELPVVAQVLQQFSNVNLVSVATAVGAGQGPSPGEYMRSQGLSFPVALDDTTDTLAQAFGIQAFPTIFFVNSDGTVQQVYEGELAAANLQQAVQNLLESQ